MCVYLGCRAIQIPAAVTRSARVHALSATTKDNTHILKMEVRDQSSDGQVGESERYLIDCRLAEGARKGSLLWFV